MLPTISQPARLLVHCPEGEGEQRAGEGDGFQGSQSRQSLQTVQTNVPHQAEKVKEQAMKSGRLTLPITSTPSVASSAFMRWWAKGSTPQVRSPSGTAWYQSQTPSCSTHNHDEVNTVHVRTTILVKTQNSARLSSSMVCSTLPGYPPL